MTTYIHRNHVRTHRRRSGLSQRELARVVGCGDQWQVSRHEHAHSAPTLRTALAYQIVFRVPVSTIFVEIMQATEKEVESRISALEQELMSRRTPAHAAGVIAQKLQWIKERAIH